jgi:hypothetical protein
LTGRKAALAALCALVLGLVIAGASRLIAQIEGDRGIPPIASTEDIEVSGIEVNATGKNAEEARQNGWRIAQRKAWEQYGGTQVSDSQLDAMVSAIVIEREQIGPRRYVARLGVVFDRTRAGPYMTKGPGGAVMRSAPMLVIPVLYSGGVRQVFEVRGPWQRAWANFQTSASPIDYVRPTGAGGESLILNAGQTGRRSRIWWRTVLDQFNAADVLMPIARLERQYPGGPVRGTFTARYGPDNTFLESFTLTAPNDDGIPDMMNKALVQMDRIYRNALAQGVLTPDPTLMSGERQLDAALAEIAAKLQAAQKPTGDEAVSAAAPSTNATTAATDTPSISTYAVQFATPDAATVDAALSAVRGQAGVRGAATTSIAIGGTSVMRVTTASSLESLAAGLRAQGWQVTIGQNAIRISR